MDPESWKMLYSCVVLILCIFSILWYTLLMFALWRCAKKSTTFMLLTSQGFCDIYALSQVAWFSILSVAAVEEESWLPDQWLSFIHSSFELICLPHYLIIALNRSLFLIDPHSLATYFTKRVTLILCILMWIVPVGFSIFLHLNAADDDEGFFLYDGESFTVSSDVNEMLVTTLQKAFDLSYYVVVGVLCGLYGIAIAIYTCRVQKLFKVADVAGPATVTTSNRNSASIPLELRLTIVCLCNLIPSIFNSVYDFVRPGRSQPEMMLYAIMNLLDNSINSILLPLFSQLLRENLKEQLANLLFRNTQATTVVTPITPLSSICSRQSTALPKPSSQR